MVPTMRPSPNTSILAPTRCGVEPVVATMVTSAAGSPRSSAAATAAKTSRFINGNYSACIAGGRNCNPTSCHPPILQFVRSSVQLADLVRLAAGDERLGDDLRAVRRRELAGLRVDIGEDDAV